MSIPEKRKFTNIQASILKFVKTNFETAYSLTNIVNYRDRTFDESKLPQWVAIDFIGGGAGKKSFSLVQFTIYSRVGGRLSTGDRYGDAMNILVDKLHNAMHVDSIPVYDYSTKASPVIIAKAKVIVRNSNGKLREPESVDELEPDVDGVISTAVTYRFEFIGDLSRAVAYYD